VAAPFNLARKRLLCTPKFARLRTIPPRIINCFSRRKHRQRLQADINADTCLNWSVGSWRDLLLHNQADIPMPTGFALEGRALRDTLQWSMHNRLDQADLRNRDERINQHNRCMAPV